MSQTCQSCGMPLEKDPEGGGKNADGTASTLYCSLCFHDGEFRNPDFDVKQMQDFCVGELRKKGMPKFLAWLFTRGIPKLDRWKTE